MLDHVCEIISNIFDRITMDKKIAEDRNRAFELLDAFKPILGKRKHVDIDLTIGSLFPKLFSFEACGILFVDGVERDANEAQNLFRINHLPEDCTNPYDANRGFAGIVLFPRTIGLTGEAI